MPVYKIRLWLMKGIVCKGIHVGHKWQSDHGYYWVFPWESILMQYQWHRVNVLQDILLNPFVNAQSWTFRIANVLEREYVWITRYYTFPISTISQCCQISVIITTSFVPLQLKNLLVRTIEAWVNLFDESYKEHLPILKMELIFDDDTMQFYPTYGELEELILFVVEQLTGSLQSMCVR